jgi:hypothetical protein
MHIFFFLSFRIMAKESTDNNKGIIANGRNSGIVGVGFGDSEAEVEFIVTVCVPLLQSFSIFLRKERK